jgi:hypothetical protein
LSTSSRLPPTATWKRSGGCSTRSRRSSTARDWGGADQEPALGAAAHVGRSEIAPYLLDRGALV